LEEEGGMKEEAAKAISAVDRFMNKWARDV